jgi:hypothetical protein
MTKFYMKWQISHMFAPMDPEERMKFWYFMLESVRADLKSGALTDWGMCLDNSGGYAFAETDEKTLQATIMKWTPYINFDIKPVLTVDQTIDSMKQGKPKK